MVDKNKLKTIENSIIEIRDKQVIIDSDVASFYGVQTRDINKSVANNPDKFPQGYILELDKNEWDILKCKYSTSKQGGKNKLPKAFTEKGLYMLATILKSKKATETTIQIIEIFSKIKELQNDFNQILAATDENKKNIIGGKFGKNLLNIFLNDGLQNKESETKIKFSMFGMSLEKTIKKEK
ncbi:MAG: ORF6N domain-containing protein [Gammaproteobacteria bacterium]|nr:MAG: ORF6N domain-containing protein [Gammaproteobacteria bacterium]